MQSVLPTQEGDWLPEQESDGVGSTRELVQTAGNVLEDAGFSRLGGARRSPFPSPCSFTLW